MSGVKFGSTGVPTKAYPIFSRIRGYWRYVNMLYSLRKFDHGEIAKERMKIIKFYEQYGERATKEAFGADRKVISRWKRRLQEGNNSLMSLIPASTAPHTVRRSAIPEEVINFIKNLREKRPRLGKEKIKPLLDKFCRQKSLKTTSESTVGNIIRKNHFFFQKAGRIYHNPASKWADKRLMKPRRIRIKHAPKPEDFGHIMADTVVRIIDGIKHYFYSAIDIKLKFVLTLHYKRLNSRNMKDFYDRFKTVYPGIIKDWQTDNGLENLGELDDELNRQNILHIFSYPHCPKINAYIERYNRTVQEEFIDNNLDIIHDEKMFNRELADYLIFYNTERPHKSLGLKSPIDYLISNGAMSHKSLTYTRI